MCGQGLAGAGSNLELLGLIRSFHYTAAAFRISASATSAAVSFSTFSFSSYIFIFNSHQKNAIRALAASALF